MKDYFKLVGECRIPEGCREELNRYALKLLDRCGIRKLRTIDLNGTDVEVTSRLSPDEDGIVRFDYSILEKEKKEECTYNMKTCGLSIPYCGFNEFGLALMALMTLLESYSETPCFMACDGKFQRVNGIARLIEYILGIRLRFPHRANSWDMFLLCRKHLSVENVSILDVIDWIPESYEEYSGDLLHTTAVVIGIMNHNRQLKKVDFQKERIPEMKTIELDHSLYTVLLRLKDANANIISYVRNLLKQPIEERKRLAEENTDYGCITELSLYVMAPTLIGILSAIESVDFWDLWDDMTKDGYYRDDFREPAKPSEKDSTSSGYPFYKATFRESEDVFLGEWDDRELVVSERMKNAVEAWKKYHSIAVPADYDMKQELLSLLQDIQKYWSIRLVDECFVEDFVRNKENDAYKKGLLLLRSVADRYVEDFPELTRKQALAWVIRYCRTDFDSDELTALIGVLSNIKVRKTMFGF